MKKCSIKRDSSFYSYHGICILVLHKATRGSSEYYKHKISPLLWIFSFVLSSTKDNFYFCTLNNLLALSEFCCSAKFVSMKTCTLVITCIICPTWFAVTYLWKMSLFAQEPCQKHFLKGQKGIKFTPKRNKGEKERKERYLMFLYCLLSEPEKSQNTSKWWN